MNKKVFLLLIIVVLIITGGWWLAGRQSRKLITDKLQVTASFYPYYFFAGQIGGDKVEVVNITPSGGEPHDYEPTSQDIVNIESGRLLILNGTVEPWAAKIKSDLKGKSTVVLEAGSGLFTQKVLDEEGKNSTDPHVWLSPRLAGNQVKAILNELIVIDPQNKIYYQTNADKFLTRLDDLDQQYKSGLANCTTKNIVTSHAAFGYLASDYGLNQVAITGVTPDEEPSLKRLGELAQFVEKNKIRYIFFESLVSPKLAQTLASETGAKTMVLNPIEGLTPDEAAAGKDYMTIMRDNLQNLRVALDCK